MMRSEACLDRNFCLFVFRGEVLQGGAPVCSPCFGERERCGFSVQSSDGKPHAWSTSAALGQSQERGWVVNLSFVFESDTGFHDLVSDAGASSGPAPPRACCPHCGQWSQLSAHSETPALSRRGCVVDGGGRTGGQVGQGSGHRKRDWGR